MRLERRWVAFGGLAVLVLAAGIGVGALAFSGKSSDSSTALSLVRGTTTATGASATTPTGSNTSSGTATPTPVVEPSNTAIQLIATSAPPVTPQDIVITPQPDLATAPPAPPPTSRPPVSTAPPTLAPTPAPTSAARCTELYVYYLRSALNPLSPEQFRQVCIFMGTDCLGIYVQDYLPIAPSPLSEEQFKQLCDFMGTDCLGVYVTYLRSALNPLPPDQFKQRLC